MHPDIDLDDAIVTQNARAWRTFSNAALYAVVKAEGYGWGIARMCAALEDVADAYCVADADELLELRKHSGKFAIVLGRVSPAELRAVLRANALATIESEAELQIARDAFAAMDAPLRVRIGLRPAASWSGLDFEELARFAPSLAAAGAAVHLWTHVTDFERIPELLDAFGRAERALGAAGVEISGTDTASTFALARGLRSGSAVRVGVGLFGATGGTTVPGIRCALRVRAPVVRVDRHAAGTSVGYGGTMLATAERIATGRGGYADGIPFGQGGQGTLLSIGMQYVTAALPQGVDENLPITVLDQSSDLDAFAASAGRLPHEIVCSLGNATRARRAL